MKRKVFAICLLLGLIFSATQVYATNEELMDFSVSYRGHIQNVGDYPTDGSFVSSPDIIGTVGESKRIEGFQILLSGFVPDGVHIYYNVHVQNKGWLYDENNISTWAKDGGFAGTKGESLRIEAIKIRLADASGNPVENMHVFYRGHVQNIGNMPQDDNQWDQDGEQLGTVGSSLRLEALQVKVSQIGANLIEYNTLVSQVTDLNEVDYTVYSWNYLKTMCQENRMTVENSQEEVDQAVATIRLAYDLLESEVTAIVYSQAGIYGPTDGIETINQDVIIKADGVILQNLVIEGNLIITEDVGDGDITLNNIIVEGETRIRGGGLNSIHINGGKYSRITVQKTATGELRIVATDKNGLAVVIAEDATDDTVILEGQFESVQVNAPGVNIRTQGNTQINNLKVGEDATDCQVDLAEGTNVGNIILDSGADVKGKGTIDNAEVNADGVVFEIAPTKVTVDPGVEVPPIVTPPVVPPGGGGVVNTAGAVITTVATANTQTATSITVNAAAAATNPGSQSIEYAIGTNGTTAPTTGWQAGLTLSGLSAGTDYYVWARTAAKTGYDAGTPVASAKITTNETGAVITTAATANTQTATSITVNAALAATNPGSQGIEYAIGINGTTAPTTGWQAGLMLSGLSAGTDYYVWARTATKTGYDAGTAVASAKITTNNMSGAAITTAATANTQTATSITVNAALAATNPGSQSIEYAIGTNGTTAPTTGWQAGLILSGLSPSTDYYVWARTAAQTGYDAGTPVTSAKITTNNMSGAEITTAATANTQTATSITVNAALAAINPGSQSIEYAIGTNGTTAPSTGWQAGLILSGLSPSTDYYVWARTAAQTGYDAGTPVTSAKITTNNLSGAEITTAATANTQTATSITVNAALAAINPGSQSIEYAIETSGITAPTTGWQAGLTLSGLSAGTDYYVWARTVAKTGYDAGTAVASTMITTNAAGAAITTAATANTQTTTSITVNAAAAATNPGSQSIEYAIGTNGTTAPTTGWQAGLTLSGLSAGTDYYVWARTAAKTGYDAGTPVASAKITTNETGAVITTAATANTQTATSITVNAALSATNPGSQGIEYAIGINGTTAPTTGWQAGLMLSGLSAGTDYYVWARTAAKTGYDAGTPVASVKITTNNLSGAVITTAATANTQTATSITVNAAAAATNPGSQSIEYAIGTNGTTAPTTGWQAGLTLSGLSASTDYYVWARTAAKTGYDAGTAVASAKITTNNMSGAAITTAATANTQTATSITVNAAAAATNPGSQSIEYAIGTNGTTAPTTGWQAGLTLSGLSAGTDYYVWARTAAQTGYDAGTAVTSAKITTNNLSGAEITTAATANTQTETSITVNAAAAATNPGSQNIEYAIGTNGTTAPTTGWQTGLILSGLSPSTDYYVWARTAAQTGYDAGTAVASAKITTNAIPSSDASLDLTAGTGAKLAGFDITLEAGPETGASEGDSIWLSVTIPGGSAATAIFLPVTQNATVTAYVGSNGGGGVYMPLTATYDFTSGSQYFWVKVVSEDGANTLYYNVYVTIS
ncbi:hypothetical protein [Acetobacterium carbinolicum]|uniref:hypothetical protein n=1 Tax=Acetobacterium carbinolicum TaxID=52690 RepID=UPI003BF4E305